MLQGRIHTSRIRALLPSTHRARSQARVRLTPDALEAITWWIHTLRVSISDKRVWSTAWFQPTSESMVRIYSDASGEIGFNALTASLGLIGWWKESPICRSESSAKSELFSMLCSIINLLPYLKPGSLVVFTTDNISDCFSINKAYSKADTIPMLSYMFELAAHAQVYILCDWAPRDMLTICDILSKAYLHSSGHLLLDRPTLESHDLSQPITTGRA